MGFLDRAIKNGIGSAISGAVEKVTAEVIAPAANQAAKKVADRTTDYANKTAASLDAAARDLNAAAGEAGVQQQSAGLESLGGLFSTFQSAAAGFAGAAAQNMKVCGSCGAPAGADEKFCPNCGAALPEITVGALYLCGGCGQQNDVGKRFCTACGAKLPATLKEESELAAKDRATLAQWTTALPLFPVWAFGGHGLVLEDMSDGFYSFSASDVPRESLLQYRELLKQHGFRPAGKSPADNMLYKMVGGTCWFFDSCDPYSCDPGKMCVSFGKGEPVGGFDYVEPERRKSADLGDLMDGLGDLKGGLKDLKNKFRF